MLQNSRLAFLVAAGLLVATSLPVMVAPASAQDAASPEQEEAATPRSEPARRAPPKPAARPAPTSAPARPAQPVAQAPTQPAVNQPAAAAARLPNGATAINEVFGDWTVDCRINDGRKLCALSQSQGNSQTNQRVFAIELRAPKSGKAEGTILMPFGLRLENGAVLRLDDKDLGQGLRFSTCVPAGCLLPISFPTVATDALQKGKTLTAAALNLSTGEAVTFNISLNGFASALTRIAQLDD